MACAWIESDQVALRRALRLVEDARRGVPGAHSALTALEDRLGLTPKARRQLQWEIDRGSSGKAGPDLAVVPDPAEAEDDPRAAWT